MHHFTSFDGTDIAYLDTGTGPFVFLLHGFAADHQANWVQPGVVSALEGAGHRVIAPDTRGHGQSGKPHDPASYGGDTFVLDVQALMGHLAVAHAHLVGYSMGSIIAARLVPLEPRAQSLVLGGIGGHFGAERSEARRAGLADALEADDPASIADPVARAFRQFAEVTGADRLALAAIQRAPAGERAELDRIAVPTLVLTGDQDVLVGSPDELAARIPGAVAKTLHGDHLGAVNDPAFPASIVEFIGSVRTG